MDRVDLPQRLSIFTEFFGCNRRSAVGCLLQWVALAVMAVNIQLGASLGFILCAGLTAFGVSTCVAGLALAVKGGSGGPIIVLPGLLGLTFLVVLTAILHPLSFHLRNAERR